MRERNQIWLLGDRGMLGRQIAGEFEKSGFFFYATDKEVDICQMQALQKFVHGKNITWLVNCAAYTAVDRAEDEAKLAFAINAAGVENLARLSCQIGAKLVHFSTDYVFDGQSRIPYRETDQANPLTQYGVSKWQGEEKLIALLPSYFIFRISWLYGIYGTNFVHSMLKLFREKDEVRVVNDQFGSPTYAAALAKNIVKLIAEDSVHYGLYHYSDSGVISWHEFALKIMEYALQFKLIDKQIPLLPIPTAAFPTRAARPAFSVLDKSKVQSELKFALFDWKINLEKFFREVQPESF
jgi:dTDP-4-dehydrorhamnose reductase